MEELTVKEYAIARSISTQSIYRQIKNKKIESFKRDGVTYVRVKQTQANRKLSVQLNEKNDESVSVIKILKEQIEKLDEENKRLKEKNDKLIDEKEKFLIEERNKIESIYKEKDEQIKKILEMFNTKLMSNNKIEEIIVQPTEYQEASIEQDEEELIELGEYLLYSGVPLIERVKIKHKFTELAKKEKRIIKKGNYFYLDFLHYDYDDILGLKEK